MVMPSSLAAAACGRNGSRAADRQRPTQDRPDCSGNRWLPQTMCTRFKYQGRNLSCHPPNGVCVVLPSPKGVCVVLQSPNFLDGAHFSDNRCGSFGSGAALCAVYGPRQPIRNADIALSLGSFRRCAMAAWSSPCRRQRAPPATAACSRAPSGWAPASSRRCSHRRRPCRWSRCARSRR